MKNKISDLRNHMFAALERLGSEDLTAEQLKLEIEKAKAVSELGKVIVDSAKTELLYARITRNIEDQPKKFLEDIPENKLERPPAEYSNKQHNQ